METYSRILCCLVLLQGAFGIGVFPFRRLKNERFICPEPDGTFPDSQECSSIYYLCVDGVAYEQKCPGNWIFDPQAMKCVSPQEISCSGGPSTSTTTTTSTTSTTSRSTTSSTTITTSTPTPSTTPSSVFTCPSSDGFFPIPDTCGKDYYTCINGIPYPTTCPGDSVFDPVALVCVNPDSASCNFNCPLDNGYVPIYPGACSNSYYSCISGQPYLQHCPNESIFDPNILVCVPKGTESC